MNTKKSRMMAWPWMMSISREYSQANVAMVELWRMMLLRVVVAGESSSNRSIGVDSLTRSRIGGLYGLHWTMSLVVDEQEEHSVRICIP